MAYPDSRVDVWQFDKMFGHMNMTHQFYYVSTCPYSRRLCAELFAHPNLAKQFTFHEVSRLPACQGMMVPTLLVSNKKYVGKYAFDWLKSVTFTGPGCFNVADNTGIEYGEIMTGSGGGRSSVFCSLTEAGGSPVSGHGGPPQVMDPRLARLIKERQQQIPGPCARIG